MNIFTGNKNEVVFSNSNSVGLPDLMMGLFWPIKTCGYFL